jgi:hypothetical protein
VALAVVLLWTSGLDPKLRGLLAVLVLALWWGFALAVRVRVVHPLRTLSNLLATLREEDFSFRAPGRTAPTTRWGRRCTKANALSETLRRAAAGCVGSYGAIADGHAEIDVRHLHIRFRRTATAPDQPRGRAASWGVRRSVCSDATPVKSGWPNAWKKPAAHHLQGLCRRGGPVEYKITAHSASAGCASSLLVVQDLTRTLREEELEAWKRLVRVRARLNNSLAPINPSPQTESVAGS